MDVTWMEIPRQAPRKCRRNCLPLDGRFPVAHVGIGSSPGKQCAQAIETTLRAVPPRAPEGREMKQPWSHGDGRGARQPRKMVQSVTKSKQNQAILPEFRHVNDQLPAHDRARERTD